jgi:hypothetical protein
MDVAEEMEPARITKGIAEHKELAGEKLLTSTSTASPAQYSQSLSDPNETMW